MQLAALVSPDDWMGSCGTSGKAGWHYILNRLAGVGITRVYWRVTTGWSYYASKVNNTGPVFDSYTIRGLTKLKRWWMYEAMDWSKDDTFAAATAYARRLGIELHAWLTLENAHGFGTLSRLKQEHPEMMTLDRCGKRYQRLHGWAYPEVRHFWMNIVRELVAYNPDGILLDLCRMGYLTDPPVGGVATGGYEAPMVEAFREETGRDPFQIPNDDPEWVQFRTRPFTQWVGDVRDLLAAQAKPMALRAMLLAPGSLRVVSPKGELLTPEELGAASTRDSRAYVSAGPMQDRFADLEKWASNGWLDGVCLVGQAPNSDPNQWEFTYYDGPPWYHVEPHHSRGDSFIRMPTPDEREQCRARYAALGPGGLQCSWALNPYERKTDELVREITALKAQGFDEVNINESNLLVNAVNDRWDGVEEAARQIDG